MAKIGLATHFVGFRSSGELRDHFKQIRRDEVKIFKALNYIKEAQWKRDFSPEGSFGIRIPFAVAEEECPDVRLTYFNPGTVKFLLMHIIEKWMYQQNKDQPKARNMMADPQRKEFSIVFPRKEGKECVEGLGDIELLTHCDLIDQTWRNSPDITFGLTFDRSLQAALLRRTGENHTVTMIGGIDDPSESALRVAYMMRQTQRRTEKANRRAEEYLKAIELFITQVLDKHFSGVVGAPSAQNENV